MVEHGGAWQTKWWRALEYRQVKLGSGGVWILDQGSTGMWILDQDGDAWILDLRGEDVWILDLGRCGRHMDPGSWILDRGSAMYRFWI